MNKDELAELLLDIFGIEVWDDTPVETAARVIKYWQEFSPTEQPFTATKFPAQAQLMIVVRDIRFASLCCHHLLPFHGVAHVAYLPHEWQVGLSKIPRLVEWRARQPQTQERLTHEISSWMQNVLKPKGSAVIIRAVHTCMSCRGVESHEASMITSEIRGVFLTAGEARQEFMSLCLLGGTT